MQPKVAPKKMMPTVGQILMAIPPEVGFSSACNFSLRAAEPRNALALVLAVLRRDLAAEDVLDLQSNGRS